MAHYRLHSVQFSRVLITSMNGVGFYRVSTAHYHYVQCSGLQGKYGSLPLCTVFSYPE